MEQKTLVQIKNLVNEQNRNKNFFDNLDYKPENEVENLKQLLKIV